MRAVALVLSFFVAGTVRADFDGRVVKVHDGDTLTVLVDRTQVRVRLVDIDAPELHQAFGRRSRESLASMCAGQAAHVTEKGQDRFGRALGYVTVPGLGSEYRAGEARLRLGVRPVRAEGLAAVWAAGGGEARAARPMGGVGRHAAVGLAGGATRGIQSPGAKSAGRDTTIKHSVCAIRLPAPIVRA